MIVLTIIAAAWLLASLLFVLAVAAAARRPMASAIPSHVELIVCPGCGADQEAVVEHTEPWWSYATTWDVATT